MENQLEAKQIQLTVYINKDSISHTRLFKIDEIKQMYDKLVIDINNHKENTHELERFEIKNVIVLGWHNSFIILNLKEANNLKELIESYLIK